jgi:hypothetical protein
MPIIDFNDAEVVDDQAPTDSNVVPVDSAEVVGNPPFMSPMSGVSDENLKTAITGAQLIGGMTPFSPAVQGLGTVAKELISGSEIDDALIKGGESAAIDAAFTYAGGKLIQGGSAVARFLLKAANQGVRPEIMKEVFSNPTLLEAPAKTLDQSGSIAYDAIKGIKAEMGALVGQAKDAVRGLRIKVDLNPVRESFQALKKEAGMIGSDIDIKAAPDESGYKAFKKLEEYINDVFKKPLIKREASPAEYSDLYGDTAMRPMMKFKGLGMPQDTTTVEQALTRIDESAAFQKIYDKMALGKDLSHVETLALQARGELNSALIKATDVLWDEAALKGPSLSEAKSKYSALRTIIDDPLISRAQKSKDAATSVIKNSVGVGSAQRYQRLREIESLLSPENAFMDDVIRNSVEGTPMASIDKSSIINKAVAESSRFLLRPKKESTKLAGRAAGSLLRRGAIDQTIEDNSGLY